MLFFSKTHERWIKSIFASIQRRYNAHLVSLAVFGSYARGEARLNSDLDLLIILRDKLGKSRLQLQEDFVKEVELPLQNLADACFQERICMQISSLFFTQEQARHFVPLYLDMTEACEIIYDPNNFLRDRLIEVKKQMKVWGSRKTKVGGHWMWEIKPGLQWNEVVDYDQ